MSTITEESARDAIRALTNRLENSNATLARVEARLQSLLDVLSSMQSAAGWARYKGANTMPVAEAMTLFRRLWDVATLGKDGGAT
jgi:hypothetical protein